MQISGMLRRGGAGLSLLVLIPGAAMGAAGVVAKGQKPDYTMVATTVITPVTGVTGGAAVGQAVDGFQSALTTDVVTQAAAKKAGFAASDVANFVTSKRLGSGGVVEITYTGPRASGVKELLEAEANGALQLVFGGDLDAAVRQEKLAKQRFDKASAAVAAVSKKTGLILPSEEYRAKANEVSQLRVALAQAETHGDPTSPVKDALASSEKTLSTLRGSVKDFDQPQYELDRARTNLADADEQLATIQSGLAASQSPAMLHIGPGSNVSRTADILRTVVAAGVIGLIIAIPLVLLLEMLRRRRRSSAVRGTGHTVSSTESLPAPSNHALVTSERR